MSVSAPLHLFLEPESLSVSPDQLPLQNRGDRLDKGMIFFSDWVILIHFLLGSIKWGYLAAVT